MKKVILTIATIATLFSCTTEDIAESTIEVSRFTGNYELYQFLVTDEQSGDIIDEVVFDCPRYWTFDDTFNITKRVYQLDRGDCVYKYLTQNVYSTPEDDVIIIGDTEYKLLVVNGATVLESTNDVGITRSYYINRI